MTSSLGNKEIMATNIRRHLDKLGMNVKDFATTMNFKYTTVLDWVNAKTYPRIDKIEMMANFFKVEKSDLVEIYSPSLTPSQSPTDELTDQINAKVVQLTTPRKKVVLDVATEQLEEQENEEMVEIYEDLIEYHVYERLSAGTGYGYTEGYNYDVVYYDEDISHDLASWIYGDSMEPAYLNGEVALIKDTGFDYDGAVYAVDWAGQTYIKKVYKEKDGLRLVSLNRKYAPLFAHKDEEPRIIGKVVGHFMPVEG